MDPLKDKTGRTILKTFIRKVNESNRKQKKLWDDQERKIFNKII